MFDNHRVLTASKKVKKFKAVSGAFWIRAQVLIKQNIFLDIWIIHFIWNINNFSTDMSAKFVLLKLCLNGIERWLPAKRSKDHRCKTSYSRSERKYFWTCKWPISVKIYVIFPRTWAQYLFHWSSVWLTFSFDCRRNATIKFIAAKYAIRDQSASFNQAKLVLGHTNEPFQLKY